MTYTPQTWTNGSGGGTPINASRLQYIETGIAAAVAKDTFVVSVTDHGADPTGTTDSTTVIQAASDLLSSTGGTCYFPVGTYKTGTLQIPSGVTICGAGPKSIIKAKDSLNERLLRNVANGDVNITIRDLTLDGNKANQTTNGILEYGVYFASVSDCWVERVVFQNMGQDGILVGSDGPVVQSKRVHISRCHFTNCGRNGISFISTDDSTIDDCTFVGAGSTYENGAIDIEPDTSGISCSNNKVSNCRIVSWGSSSVQAGGIIVQQTTGTLAENNQITNCNISNCGASGINVWEATRTLISNTEVWQCSLHTSNAYAGITLTRATRSIVSACHVRDCGAAAGGEGIQILNADQVVVQGCVVRRNYGSGISLRGATNGTFTGNIVEANGRVSANTLPGYYIATSAAVVPAHNTISGGRVYDVAGASGDQKYGIWEVNGDQNTFLGVDVRGNRTAGILLASASTGTSRVAASSGFNPLGYVAPTVPASGVAFTNGYGVDCSVTITGGTVSFISIGGTSTNLSAPTPATYTVPFGQTILLNYSVAPTWRWFGE